LLRERQGARLIIRTAASRGQKALEGASALLRQHPVFDFEILARMRHELGVARVIDAFHPDDLLRQLRIVLADMFDQRGLGVAGPVTRIAPASATDCATACRKAWSSAACPLPIELAL
jgi:hypothetical protein